MSKSAKAAYKEAARFRSAASRLKAPVIIGHIRQASNPRRLRFKNLISEQNSQPYTHGRIVFAHNGILEIPNAVAARLGPYRNRLKGNNDSEVYFWQFIKFHDELGDIPKALKACIRENWQVWRANRSKYRHKKAPYTGMNVMVSDGRTLHTLCHSVSEGMHKYAISTPNLPWQVLNFSRRGDRLLVASENTDRGRWTRFSMPEILSAEICSGKLKIRRRRFEFEPLKRRRS